MPPNRTRHRGLRAGSGGAPGEFIGGSQKSGRPRPTCSPARARFPLLPCRDNSISAMQNCRHIALTSSWRQRAANRVSALPRSLTVPGSRARSESLFAYWDRVGLGRRSAYSIAVLFDRAQHLGELAVASTAEMVWSIILFIVLIYLNLCSWTLSIANRSVSRELLARYAV